MFFLISDNESPLYFLKICYNKIVLNKKPLFYLSYWPSNLNLGLFFFSEEFSDYSISFHLILTICEKNRAKDQLVESLFLIQLV